MNNELFYHDMQNDDVTCQTIHGSADYHNLLNYELYTMRP